MLWFGVLPSSPGASRFSLALTAIVLAGTGLLGPLTGCNRMPDSYTATVRVNQPGEAEIAPDEVRIEFKRGAMRVDLQQGGAMGGFALAWRDKPQIFVMMPGREYAYRQSARDVSVRYGVPQLSEVLVLPFTASPWMKGARLMGGGQPVDGQPCELWAKLTDKYLYRIWVHEKWAIPMRFETAEAEGRLVARYELRGLKPFAQIDDSRFKIPPGMLAPAIPPGMP